MNGLTIDEALAKDAIILTDIAFKAKHTWNYPEKYFKIWKNELTITKKYIETNTVYIAKQDSTPIGFYSLAYNRDTFYSGEVLVEKGHWLEHIFVLPEYHKKRIGTALLTHAHTICKNQKINTLFVFADPFAKGFYEKQGARFKYMSKSSIKDRLIPVYEFDIKG